MNLDVARVRAACNGEISFVTTLSLVVTTFHSKILFLMRKFLFFSECHANEFYFIFCFSVIFSVGFLFLLGQNRGFQFKSSDRTHRISDRKSATSDI